MRLSGLSLALLLVIATSAFAQHSGGGGGSSGGSSAGGGGSHGGGGVSAASSASHSSGSASSSSHSSSSSSSHGKSGASGAARASEHASAINAQPAKRGFFAFLRHPFRKTEPASTNVNTRFCRNGFCRTCPAGQVANGIGGCMVGQFFARRNEFRCSRTDIWTGGICLNDLQFMDPCSGLLMSVQQQEHRVQEADSVRQRSCANGGSPECSDRTTNYQSEASLYQTFQTKYQACRSGHAVNRAALRPAATSKP
jgi:hypothetical protein